MSQTCSPSSREYSKQLAHQFVTEFGLADKQLFEIGCGDGEFLKYLEEDGVQTVGIEPSAPFAKLAQEKGLAIRVEYFDDTTTLAPDSFDAFASRAVFEHLKDPHEILRNVKKVLKEGGVGMIEVPSFEKAIRDRRYYDVFSDHVAYYTKRTLILLLERHGFEILKAFNAFEGEFIVVYFCKNAMASIEGFAQDFNAYRAQFRSTLDDLKRRGKRTAIWGAGGKGNAVLSVCDVRHDDIVFVIDSAPHKIGKYTIGSHFPIVSPDTLRADRPDAIIISAMAFSEEIRKILKEKYAYAGEVYVISPMLRRVL